MNTNQLIEEDLNNCLSVLKKGGSIIYPTDTIWGLGCDATNEKAVSKIYKMKLRHESKSMIILIDEIENLYNYVNNVPEVALSLMEAFKTPITLIYSGAKNLPKSVINKDGSIAIRVTKDNFCKNLIKQFQKPIISTSVNISGYTTPILFKDIDNKIIEKVGYSCKHSRDEIRQIKPSLLIKLKNDFEYEVIRD